MINLFTGTMLSPTFEPSTYSAIANWYAQQKILVTGGTGFLGKVFIVKLLLSCPEVGKIYILIRPKKGKEPKERLLNYLNGKVRILVISRFYGRSNGTWT